MLLKVKITFNNSKMHLLQNSNKYYRLSFILGDSKIDIANLTGYIIGCMKELMMKACYTDLFLSVLYKYVLNNSKCRDSLDKDDWEGTF